VPQVTLTVLDVLAEAVWDFRDGRPHWREPASGHPSGTFDPFPGYRHDEATARAALDVVTRAWPPAWDIGVYLADREDTGRTNGYSHLHVPTRREGDQWVEGQPAGLILLSGKRVPPHPAMTAYLVGHEYGHHVEWSLNQRDRKPLTSDAAARRYLTVRGLDDSALFHGDGGRWHTSVHEILACDFRVLIAGLEPGFWPHPGVPRPEDVPGLAYWWDEQQEQARNSLSLTGSSVLR
jgi:hypothetical protein